MVDCMVKIKNNNFEDRISLESFTSFVNSHENMNSNGFIIQHAKSSSWLGHRYF